MLRYLPHAMLLCICATAFSLWHYNIYPFSDPVFAFEGYALHIFGGIAYVTLQVLFVCVLRAVIKKLPILDAIIKLPHVPYKVHTLFAFYALLIIEFQQFLDPLRSVQWQDVLAQTCGIVLSLAVIWLFDRNNKP